ncbi:MAG: fibronectin type III domain-containing protein [Candidatus Thiodiazotropha sp.]
MLNSAIYRLMAILAISFYLTGCDDTPTVSLSAKPMIVSENGSTTLSWTSTGVTSCEAAGDWSGVKDITGTETIGPLLKDSTFTLSCTGEYGSAEAAVEVKIGAPDATTVNLSATPVTVSPNGTTTLSWDSVNADSCTASGDWSGSKEVSGSETISSIAKNSTFNLSCSGANGNASDSVAVTVNRPPALTLDLSANPTDISYNGSTTLNWHSNADSCTASGAWSGNKGASGSETINSLTETSTFSLSCNSAGTGVNDTVTVTVAKPATPTIDLTADPMRVSYNGSTTLSWRSENTDSCAASGDWSGSRSSAGSEAIDALTESSTFTLSCTGDGGTVSDTLTITVEALPAPTIDLSATPTSVPKNGSVTLNWNATNADSCSASGDWSGSKDTSGTETISSLVDDSRFILNCRNANDSASASVDVTVVASSTGTALLSWTPPTENTDGSALTDLAGYRIYYGTSPGNYSHVVTIDSPGITSYQIDNLTPGDWYFVITSFNSSNVESTRSNEVSKTIY